MRGILIVTIFCFALPQVSAQLQIPEPETSALVTSLVSPAAQSIETPLNLTQAMLAPQSRISNQGSAIRGHSFVHRPHLAFFCRVEVELEQAAKMPIRFRLGSVDYVDYLEGKRSQ